MSDEAEPWSVCRLGALPFGLVETLAKTRQLQPSPPLERWSQSAMEQTQESASVKGLS